MSSVLKSLPGLLFGADPELFLVDKNGTPVSAAGLIPGTKDKPFPVEFGAVQVDGMAAEFNIDPAPTYKEFTRNIRAVVKQLEDIVPKGLTLAALPAVRFSKEVFDSAPPEAKELGCSPDFNAWTGNKNKPPRAANDPFMRTAAGHLHIGWRGMKDKITPEHIGHCNDLVRQLDFYLGAWSITKDADTTRRSLYGKAGACRYKTYGVEYRVLSNFWVLRPEYHLQVWNRMQRAILDMQDYCIEDVTGGALSKNVIRRINNSDMNQLLPEYPVSTITRAAKNKALMYG